MLQWPNWMLAISVSRRSEVRVSCSLQDCHDYIFLCIHNAVWIWLCSHMCVFIWQDVEVIYLGYLSCFCIACVCLFLFLSSSTICISSGVSACLQLTNFTLHHHFCVGICVSLHMQVRLRSINAAQGGLWSAAGERNTPLARSTYTLFGRMIYELCPRVAGFIFLLLTAPPLRGLGPLWDEGKETRFFDPWTHQTAPDVQLFFTLMELGWSR